MAEVQWTGADGTVINLDDTDAGYTVLGEGTRGLRSVSYAMTTQNYAGSDGETVQSIRAVGNDVSLGLLVAADDPAEFAERVRLLRRAMRPKAGPGVLSIRSDTGELRELTCYCTAGFEGDESIDVSLPGRWWKLLLKLYAPDPWWYGDSQSISIGLGAPTIFFPIFPLTLSPSSVQGNFTVDMSDSDAPVYPVWTIIGPGSSLVLTNLTTNRSLTVNATVAAGDSIVIDTRPSQKSVRRGDGTNLLSSVVGDPELWSLTESVNQVSAVLTGATSASRVVGQFAPRYAGI